ncbi:MAG: NAD(P)H-dependent oxidoreductase subunit E [Nocardioidaceae bacterium]
MSRTVESILAAYLGPQGGADRTRLLDMLHDLQGDRGWLPEGDLRALATGLGTTYLDVRETASFYHLFHLEPAGRFRLHLADTVVARMNGFDEVLAALEDATGAPLGGVSPDGLFGLFTTPCIGLSDQEPAMLVDDVVFTRLKPKRVRRIIEALREGISPRSVAIPGDLPPDTREYVESMVETNVRTRGPVFFRPRVTPAEGVIAQALTLEPTEVIQRIAESELRGRGGAGFSTGLKWRLASSAPGPRRHVICNADEGEPGTFKDRALLTRTPELVFTGMIVAAHAIGAQSGLVYLRAEYAYLEPYLQGQLGWLRQRGLLGRDIGGKAGFDFDIRIQLGAGAYVCGEESALIESCEGRRGQPRLKPPFPAQAGYLGEPTCIDNVESFVAVARIIEEGSHWFESMGTQDSTGTRLISVAGDVARPGIYEIEWGTTVAHVLHLVGAQDPYAVQVGGPSGDCISVAHESSRRLAFEDLGCNGAFTVFDSTRDLLGIVREHMKFFVAESCGICAPCRIGNGMLLDKIDAVRAGRVRQRDLDDLERWGTLIRRTSRCGLGATSPKPVLTTLAAFPEVYAARLAPEDGPLRASFDAEAAVADYARLAGELVERRTADTGAGTQASEDGR